MGIYKDTLSTRLPVFIESIEETPINSDNMNIVAGRDIQAKGDIMCGGKYSVFQNIFQSV